MDISKTPILISVPHSGTLFPNEIKDTFKTSVIQRPEDTDWFIDRLYDFSKKLNISIIKASYSRYVIDLNRDPSSKALYGDGRRETSLCPIRSFKGDNLYQNNPPSPEEVQRRLDQYYWPYYKKIQAKIDQLKKINGKVLFFDAHSIKRKVKSIQEEAFPDLILGSADQTSASKNIINCALNSLNEGPYKVTHNHPFKGGHLTRYFGRPKEGVHALQLEMSQDIYMNEETIEFDDIKADALQLVLIKMFNNLIVELSK